MPYSCRSDAADDDHQHHFYSIDVALVRCRAVRLKSERLLPSVFCVQFENHRSCLPAIASTYGHRSLELRPKMARRGVLGFHPQCWFAMCCMMASRGRASLSNGTGTVQYSAWATPRALTLARDPYTAPWVQPYGEATADTRMGCLDC